VVKATAAVVSTTTMMAASTAVSTATVVTTAAFAETLHDGNGTSLNSTKATFRSRQPESNRPSTGYRPAHLPGGSGKIAESGRLERHALRHRSG
jgi:hypothetical protein